VRLAELASLSREPGLMQRVIERFARYRLLTLDRDPVAGGSTVEVAHEALLRAWERLRDWLDTSRNDLRLQRQLGAAAAEWARAGQDSSYLAAGARLAQFEALAGWGNLALTAEEQTYLARSVAERERHAAVERVRHEQELATARRTATAQRTAADRLRLLVMGLAVFLLVAAALTVFAFSQQAEASKQREQAQQNAAAAQANAQTAQTALTRSQAARLAAEATSLLQTTSDRQLIALLSIRSLRSEYTLQGEAALWAATALDYPVLDFQGGVGWISTIAFSPDGRFVVAGGLDGRATVWDTLTGRQLRSFQRANSILDVAVSPDGKTVLSGQIDESLFVGHSLDIQTGQTLSMFRPDAYMRERVLAFTPDGKQVLCAGLFPDSISGAVGGLIQFFDLSTGAHVRDVPYSSPVNAVVVSPDGTVLAVGADDGSVAVLDAATGGVAHSFPAHPTYVASIAFSSDGKTLLTAGDDGTAALWDAGSGQLLHRLTGLSSGSTRAVFSPDGKTILTVSHDRTARLWDAATGRAIRRIVYSDEFGAGSFAPDGRFILTATMAGTVQRWPVTQQLGVRRFPGRLGYFSPDGKYILTIDGDATHLWETASGREIRSFSLPGSADSDVWAISADDKYVARENPDGLVLWDARSGEELHRYPMHVDDVTIAPDDKYVLAGMTVSDTTSPAAILDAAVGGTLFYVDKDAHRVSSVAVSPDARILLTGNVDGTTNLWDFDTAKELRRLSGHAGDVIALAVSPDGRRVLTGSQDRTACLWDTATGNRLRCFQGHADRVTQVAFSPDGRQVLTSSADKTARVWDATTGAEVRRFSARDLGADQAIFSRDGRYVLTAGGDQPVTLWNADYQAAIQDLCTRLKRDFTADERTQYNIADNKPTCP
jgi:WD40 repeat protein